MTEIMLKCPKCGTEYHLPATAIPPEGREVECTACNNSWLALAGKPSEPGPQDVIAADENPTAEEASDVMRHEPSNSRASHEEEVTPGAPPPLRRRLPDNVVKILQEEAEYERQARMGEKGQSDLSLQGDLVDLWPATTITDPSDPESRPVSQEPKRIIKPVPAPMPQQETIAEKPEYDIPAVAAPMAVAAPKKSRSGYWGGIGVALIAAAVALVMYLIPVTETGGFADNLSRYQQHVDVGRNWLQERVSSLTTQE